MAISLLVYAIRVNDLNLGVYDYDCSDRLFGYCFRLKATTEGEREKKKWNDTNECHSDLFVMC